jgi:hypothetical protein
MSDLKFFTMPVSDREFAIRVRVAAAREFISQAELLRRAVAAYLEELEGKNGS